MKTVIKLAVMLVIAGSNFVWADDGGGQKSEVRNQRAEETIPINARVAKSIRILTGAEFNSQDPITIGENQIIIINWFYAPPPSNDPIRISLDFDEQIFSAMQQGEMDQSTSIIELRAICEPLAVGDTTFSIIVNGKSMKEIKFHIVQYLE